MWSNCRVNSSDLGQNKTSTNHFLLSPWRVIDDCGGAFSMGLIGGSLFNFVGGWRHAPSGLNRRAIGGLVRLKERAPVLGGQACSYIRKIFPLSAPLEEF